MAALRFYAVLSLLAQCIILINFQVQAADEEEILLQGINSYRTSQNLTALKKNDNAACLAHQIAEQFKSQPCTNTTGANTVPGTENQFSNLPELVANCKLSMTNTRAGNILPACVPDLVPSLVLSNFTKTQYSGSLNDTQYDGAGIGSEGNWIVVVLTTNTSSGSFETAGPANFAAKSEVVFHLLVFLIGGALLL